MKAPSVKTVRFHTHQRTSRSGPRFALRLIQCLRAMTPLTNTRTVTFSGDVIATLCPS
jgi:hypothetical protein